MKYIKIIIQINWLWMAIAIASVSNLFFEGGYIQDLEDNNILEYMLAVVTSIWGLLLVVVPKEINHLLEED